MKKTTTRTNATWVMAVFSMFFGSFTLNAQKVHEENLALVSNFSPKPLWRHFGTLCSIPRCSNNELAVSQLIVDLAAKNHFTVIKDSLNNVLVRVPAFPGFENYPSICVQGHLDMVCQSKIPINDIFPIQLIVKDDTLSANGTTLGADNGFGVSAMMTLMTDSKIKHVELELLFTTGEEIGLIGAKGFDYSLLKSKKILNVDSEEEGVLTVGCAGGAVMQTTMIPKFIDSDRTGYKYMIKVSGFKGGHSGQDINLGRANAIRVMTRLLSELKDFKLISLSGGSAINTIPRECEATIFLSEDKEKSFLQTFNHLTANFSSEFPLENPVFDLQKISSEDKQYKVMVKSDQDDLLSTLGKLPDGVIQMESINKKMVRTSNNIGSIKMQGDTVLTSMLFRSSSNLQIDSVKKVIELICIGKKTEMLFRLPPWEPHFDIELIKTAVATYENIFHKKLEVKTVHGGLECSIFYEKISGAQIISFGPSVSRAHTPDECVHIPSVQMFWNFLLASIK